MAGGMYTLDPVTGQPLIQTASGALLPLPLSEEEMRAAGAQLAPPPGAPVAPPPPGPDLRVAGPGGGPADLGTADPAMAQFIAERNQAGQADALRRQLLPQQPATGEHPTQPQEPGWMPTGRGVPERATQVGVDPSTLALPGGARQAAQAQGEGSGLDDPLVQQAMAEAVRAGGGGPRRLGVTGETRKLKTSEFAMDPALAAEAEQAQQASEGYNEQLAISLRERQQRAYEATQGEFAARAGQLAAAQQRYEAQQVALQEYAAKRDAAIEEARQLKAPQMEEYWGSRGDFANIMTAISITLGGALQGLRGGQNPGLEMSNQSIERWLAAKRQDYQNVQDNAARADTQFGRMVQQFGSENLALEHMREQAWEVRDGMLRTYAEKIGTPDALEAYNQAMLASEAEKAALRARASQGAEIEIEQKLAMQGGAGGGGGVLKMLRAGAEARKLRDTIAGGEQQPSFQREVQSEKTEGISAALEAVEAADEVQQALRQLGAADSDLDDPLSGAWDATVGNIPGTQGRKVKQRLEQQTALLARGIQQSLGKSDNDARLADDMAKGGGSGLQRFNAAKTAKQRALGRLQNIVSSLTPQQQQSLIQSLRANSPERAAQVEAAIGAVATPTIAPSEQVVR